MSITSGKQITSMVEQSGVPVRELADELGISNVTLYKWIVDDSFYRQYLTGANKRSLHIVHAIGDSMAPTIYDGQPVIIDTSDNRITRDGIYAFVFN